MSCSLRKWVLDLSWMQQGVLFGAFRNCDGMPSNGPHKTLIRGIRAACIKSAQPKGSFNARRPTLIDVSQAAKDFTYKTWDEFPLHFILHLLHASEVLAYCHPDKNVAQTWDIIYRIMARQMHLHVELESEFRIRLEDDSQQVAIEDEHDNICYTTDCYGDNNGVVNES